MLYAIIATVERRTDDGWSTLVNMPTFYLHSHTQGIVSVGHARRIADRMLTEVAGPGALVHVHAEKVDQ